jgi:hypothetical protein
LGSGLLQTIASLVEIPLGSTGGVSTTDESIRQQLKVIYISALYKWLLPETRRRIGVSLEKLPFKGERPILDFSTGRIVICNQRAMLPEDLIVVYGVIRIAAVSNDDLTTSEDQKAIDDFANGASSSVEVTRKASNVAK